MFDVVILSKSFGFSFDFLGAVFFLFFFQQSVADEDLRAFLELCSSGFLNL